MNRTSNKTGAGKTLYARTTFVWTDKNGRKHSRRQVRKLVERPLEERFLSRGKGQA